MLGLLGREAQPLRELKDLIKKLDVHAPIIGRYERGEVKPSIEVAVKLALGSFLDYLTGISDLQHARS